MNHGALGHLLKGVVPVEDKSLDELLKSVEATGVVSRDGDFLMPKIILSLPSFYKNRKNEFITICGMVDQSTVEYSHGFRYFDIRGRFYLEDGRTFDNRETPEDLVGQTDDSLDDKYINFSSSRWVHPQHQLLRSFFSPIVPQSPSIEVFSSYMNRMGFVVYIPQSVKRDDQSVEFVDEDSKTYRADGCVSESVTSMCDLVYKISNVDLFLQQDWSKSTSAAAKEQEWVPEMFDPSAQDETMRLKIFFDAVINAAEIAKQFGYEYTFNINTKV
jgi:hypothetical protein